MMATGNAPAVAAENARDKGELYAEAADLSQRYALGNCTSAWLETSYLLRVITGWIVVVISLITLITSLMPADRDLGLAGLALIAVLCGGLMIWPRPRSRRVRLYAFEGGMARAANAGPGPRLVVLPWADLNKVTPKFDVDHDLISCELRGHGGTKLVLGRRYEGVTAPEAIMRAAERALAGRSPGA